MDMRTGFRCLDGSHQAGQAAAHDNDIGCCHDSSLLLSKISERILKLNEGLYGLGNGCCSLKFTVTESNQRNQEHESY